MTSIGYNEVREGDYIPTFKIAANLYHRIGSLLPSPQGSANFLQIYFVGNENISCSQTTDLNLMKELQTMLHNNNKYLCETTEDQPWKELMNN